jgi:hypothetical protein
MPNITGTAAPVDAYLTCPRCKFRWLFDAFFPALQFRCSGCEWLFSLGAGGSPVSTNGAITAGTTTALPFASGGGVFLLGQALFVSDTTLSEVVIVSGTPTGTSVPVSGFANSHLSGVAVSPATATAVYSAVQAVPNVGGWGF